MRLLVIDDARVSRAHFAHVAHAEGHVVVASVDRFDTAIEWAAEGAYDVACLDGRLPGDAHGDAHTDAHAMLAARVRALCAATPGRAVVVIAALDEVETVRVARAAGAAGGLMRPVSRSGLAAVLARLAEASNEPADAP